MKCKTVWSRQSRSIKKINIFEVIRLKRRVSRVYSLWNLKLCFLSFIQHVKSKIAFSREFRNLMRESIFVVRFYSKVELYFLRVCGMYNSFFRGMLQGWTKINISRAISLIFIVWGLYSMWNLKLYLEAIWKYEGKIGISPKFSIKCKVLPLFRMLSKTVLLRQLTDTKQKSTFLVRFHSNV